MKRTRLTPRKADAILTSDWHLRETTPTCRTDDFWEAQWRKVQFVADLQKEHDCPVLHAGDLFHHWKPSPYLLSITMERLPSDFRSIYGQHDLPQHNIHLEDKSGLFALKTASKLILLPGVHFGQTPKSNAYPFSLQIKDRKILIWHVYNYIGKDPWPGITSPRSPKLLKDNPEMDLILTGDNHIPFTHEYQNRLLVNPGSLTRQTADQADHLPRVYLYYADTNSVDAVYVPVENDVVSRSHIEENEKRDERITAFISQLNGDWNVRLSFEANLERFFEKNKIRESVKNIVYKCIES